MQYVLLVPWMSDGEDGTLNKHKDHERKCMLIWQTRLLSNSKIASTDVCKLFLTSMMLM